MLLVNCMSEILKDVGQQKYIWKQVMIVIILEGFHVVVSPNLMCAIVIFSGEWLIIQCVVEGFDGWELGFPEFLSSSHVGIRVHAFCKYQIVVSQMFNSVGKFLATTFQEQGHEVFEGGGQELEWINET